MGEGLRGSGAEWGDKHLVISSKQGLKFITIHPRKKEV